MTQQEQSAGLITIGVDPHKYSWTAVAVDSQGAAVAMSTRVDATDDGFRSPGALVSPVAAAPVGH